MPPALVATVELAMRRTRNPGPNYARLFAEAVNDAVRDYLCEHRELLVPGYWAIKLRTGGPPVPARSFWCDHEPGAHGG